MLMNSKIFYCPHLEGCLFDAGINFSLRRKQYKLFVIKKNVTCKNITRHFSRSTDYF